MLSEFSGVDRERFLSSPWAAVCCGVSLCLSPTTPDPCLCPLCCRCSVPRRVDRCCSARRSGYCCCTVSRARRSSSSSQPYQVPKDSAKDSDSKGASSTGTATTSGSWRLMPAIHGVQGRWWFRQMQADSQDLIAAIHQSLMWPYRGYHGTIA
ncbi:hypothetical protein BC831DRAFT_132561 [Entophlyctis helioformis]|nr:hypothetical protein BC831DRAFT_132561 [Entophlyctis helioformis]